MKKTILASRRHRKKGKMVHFRFARTAKRGNVYQCTFSKS